VAQISAGCMGSCNTTTARNTTGGKTCIHVVLEQQDYDGQHSRLDTLNANTRHVTTTVMTTDGQTDGRTDGQTDGRATSGG